MWCGYLESAGLVLKDGLNVRGLLEEIEAAVPQELSKVDKLNLVNTLPVNKGDLYFAMGDRGNG
jgi:hypothetical protein